MSLALALMMLAQLGPRVSPGAAPPLNLPTEIERRQPPRARSSTVPATIPAPSRLQACLVGAGEDAVAAAATARNWLAESRGSAQAEPQLCLGSALAQQEQWREAEAAFLAGRDVASASDGALKARLGAMAGNAALAQGASERALALLAAAQAQAGDNGDAALAGDLAIDRARALVMLKRDGEAATALAEARRAAPGNAQAWLLSATLSRRTGQLAQAQQQIETAATLAPQDGEIGLEAGVIAMLAGREDAARRSWQSVVATDPGSEPATRAKAYLAQLGPATPAAK